MQNQLLDAADAPQPFSRPSATLALTRGVTRLFSELGLAPLIEFSLPNGRRADVAGVDRQGRLAIAEVKSCQADYDADAKWADYLPYCDLFFFAVAEDFPRAILPGSEGLIIADAYGGIVERDAVERPLAAARRKAMTLRFARQAATRVNFLLTF
ncbi:MAG: MmcB family DNA repair protein [Parvularculaceae bacterium]|nr:MmcB family DNA repair protein [Parvularculaceae bacterium]